jgi:hypothetical protein
METNVSEAVVRLSSGLNFMMKEMYPLALLPTLDLRNVGFHPQNYTAQLSRKLRLPFLHCDNLE